MLKKIPQQPQLEISKTVLMNYINLNNELCLLADKIEWDNLEQDLAPFYILQTPGTVYCGTAQMEYPE